MLAWKPRFHRRHWRLVAHMAVTCGLLLVLIRVVAPAFAQVIAPAPPTIPAGPTENAEVDVASYDLDARWDAATNQITGTATITYRNTSSDTLAEVWLKLYLNAFRDDQTQWMREATGAHRGSSYDPDRPGWIRLDSLRLVDTGEDVLPGTVDPASTVLRVPLPAARAVGPGESLRIDVAWTSQLPRVFARTGVAGDFVMAGQWYPKLAVYDRGAWDTEEWHANSEFFADFGAYTLALTVPTSYVTGATGSRDAATNNPDGTTTHRFWAASVSDVAWTAWPEYRIATKAVQAAGQTVELELLAPRTMSTSHDDRFFVAAQQSLEHLGTWFGPYPWPKLTLVAPPAEAEGAGGMEYPMFVTLSEPVPLAFGLERGLREIEVVTIHEIAHQWVPLQVATNESREAWLDEGFADYATMRVLDQMYPTDRSLIDLGPLRMGYETVQRVQYLMEGVGQPLALPSWQYPDFLTYGSTVYSKGSLAFLTLEGTLGEARFLAAMRGYFDQWRWQHPTSADLQRSLEAGTGEQLGWFFEPLVFGTGRVEYRVGDASARQARIERVGDVVMPVDVAITYADGRSERRTWDATGQTFTIVASDGDLQRIQIDPDAAIRLEANTLDNGRDIQPSPVPLLTVAARLLGLVQAALMAGVVG